MRDATGGFDVRRTDAMTNAPKRKRPGLRGSPKPFRQGDLDGLCGIYSTINAIRLLAPEVDRAAATRLFSHLMSELPKIGARPEEVVTEGLWRRALERLLRLAARKMADEYDVVLKVARMPKPLRRNTRLDALWTWLSNNLSHTSVVILALSGRHSHWTVAVEISGHQIYLLDSGDLRVLRRCNCTVGHAKKRHSISPEWVFVVTRR